MPTIEANLVARVGARVEALSSQTYSLKAEEAITAAEMSIANWLPMPDYNQRTEALHKVGCTLKSLLASFGAE